jgi:hypothetical protein
LAAFTAGWFQGTHPNGLSILTNSSGKKGFFLRSPESDIFKRGLLSDCSRRASSRSGDRGAVWTFGPCNGGTVELVSLS